MAPRRCRDRELGTSGTGWVPVGPGWGRGSDLRAATAEQGGLENLTQGPCKPQHPVGPHGGGDRCPLWVPPPCPQASGPPRGYLFSPSGTRDPPAPLRLQGKSSRVRGGGTRRDPWHAPATTLGPPAPLRAGGHPAPLTHGVHHVDVVHEVPLPQVDRELRGHERDSGVRAAPNPCPHLAFVGGETEARSARASPRAGQEEEIWAHRGGPRAHTPLLTPQWGLPQTLCSPLAQGPCSPRLGEALQ